MRHRYDDGLTPGNDAGSGLLIQWMLGAVLVLGFSGLAWVLLAAH